MCSEVSKRLRRDQDVVTMILDMTSRLIPHLHAASQCPEHCNETLSNSRTTLVNTFGVYWTKRGDLYTPATRCAILRCMTDFILVRSSHTVLLSFLLSVIMCTSSSAMADRPCHCLRPKSPLCTHKQWFYARQDTLAIRRARIT